SALRPHRNPNASLECRTNLSNSSHRYYSSRRTSAAISPVSPTRLPIACRMKRIDRLPYSLEGLPACLSARRGEHRKREHPPPQGRLFGAPDSSGKKSLLHTTRASTTNIRRSK